jgi:nucleoside-diphosphate-sugar epimerase
MARILVTGGTGALGPALLAELLRTNPGDRIAVLIRPSPTGVDDRFRGLCAAAARDYPDVADLVNRLHPLQGDVRRSGMGVEPAAARELARTVEVVLHAAADTRFRAPAEELHQANVEGAGHVLGWSAECPRLRQVVHVSTTCVAGTRTGRIEEERAEEPPGFTNDYERSKWQAERLAWGAGLPVRIVRLSTAIGGERTGAILRPGALHHALRWLSRGLAPMVPGTPESPVDLIATETAARFLARAARVAPAGVEVNQVAAGRRALPLAELIERTTAEFRRRLDPWRRGQFDRPLIVDRETFELFRGSVRQSGDVLMGQVLESVASFLPALLHPKTYATARAEAVWGGPLPLSDIRDTLTRVIDWGLTTGWGREASV